MNAQEGVSTERPHPTSLLTSSIASAGTSSFISDAPETFPECLSSRKGTEVILRSAPQATPLFDINDLYISSSLFFLNTIFFLH